jgi:hypothetical protein
MPTIYICLDEPATDRTIVEQPHQLLALVGLESNLLLYMSYLSKRSFTHNRNSKILNMFHSLTMTSLGCGAVSVIQALRRARAMASRTPLRKLMDSGAE